MTSSDSSILRQEVLRAAAMDAVPPAIADIYADLQSRIDARKPLCVVSGRCCRFDEFGHRLYVTTLELAAFVAGLPDDQPRTADPRACPFQMAKLCTVHAIRPFGCRVFFCDATSTDWQREQYEEFHRRLKTLHDRLAIAYFYVEWRQALAAILPPYILQTAQ